MIFKGSFRDNKARILVEDGKILREIYIEGKNDFDNILTSKSIKEKIVNNEFINFKEIERPKKYNVYKTIEHPRLKFITYPYEWCFEQLKTAAIFNLNLQIDLLKEGNNLKDGSAFNIQFKNTKPIFIDLMSIEKFNPKTSWPGYTQFCEQFLYPLMIQSKSGLNVNEIFKGNLEGIPLNTAFEILNKFQNYFDTKFLFHIFLLNLINKKVKKNKTGYKVKKIERSAENLIYQLNNLITYIYKLRHKTQKTVWTNYSIDNFYEDETEKIKDEFLIEILKNEKFKTICDLGCNDGRYSIIASQFVKDSVVSIDNDIDAVNSCYLKAKKNNLKILNLQLDITNPSSNCGWFENERESFKERFNFDLIINFAIIHHIVIGKNIPIESYIEYICSISKKIILEFVPKNDDAIKAMLINREDIFKDYNEENLKDIFKNKGLIIIKEKIVTKSGRKIFYLNKTDD